MNMDEKKIALLYFSRQASAESRKKRWFSGNSSGKNRALASSLILQSLKVVQQSGFPVFHFHEGNQKGRTFGERLANAYQEVFDLGYDAVIATGNDTPEIAAVNWQAVREQLNAGNCVLGPSFRGGTYLIGLTVEAFQKNAFKQLPWQTNKLLVALQQFCERPAHAPIILETLRDLNSYHDLIKVVKTGNIAIWLCQKIRQLLQNLVPGNASPDILSNTTLLINMPFRAPPVFHIV